MNATKYLVVGLLMLSTATIAQIQTNEINSTGKVGVNTTTPSCELDVVGHTHLNGSTVIEGETTMKDSVSIDKTLTIKEDLDVQGVSTFANDVNTEANLFLKQFEDLSLTKDRLVVVDKNGLAKSADFDDVLYDFDDCHVTDIFGGVTQVVPNWAYTPGVIYTGKDCPSSVGIRTDVPLAPLDVRGNADIEGAVGIGQHFAPDVKLIIKSDKNVGLCIQNEHAADFGYGIKSIIDRDNTKAFAANDSRTNEDVFRVYGDGRIEGKSLRLTLDPSFWSDYVFEQDYRLRSIEEMAAFIEQNKHLPDVPGAEEVGKNGIDVAGMDATLLRKIEELSLYVIELNEAVKSLKKDNLKLAEQLEQVRQ